MVTDVPAPRLPGRRLDVVADRSRLPATHGPAKGRTAPPPGGP